MVIKFGNRHILIENALHSYSVTKKYTYCRSLLVILHHYRKTCWSQFCGQNSYGSPHLLGTELWETTWLSTQLVGPKKEDTHTFSPAFFHPPTFFTPTYFFPPKKNVLQFLSHEPVTFFLYNSIKTATHSCSPPQMRWTTKNSPTKLAPNPTNGERGVPQKFGPNLKFKNLFIIQFCCDKVLWLLRFRYQHIHVYPQGNIWYSFLALVSGIKLECYITTGELAISFFFFLQICLRE